MTFGAQLLLAHLDRPRTLAELRMALPEINVAKTLRALVAQGLAASSVDDQGELFSKRLPVLVRRRVKRIPTLKGLDKTAGLSQWRLVPRGRRHA